MTKPVKDMRFLDRLVGGKPQVRNSSPEALMMAVNIVYRTLQRMDNRLDDIEAKLDKLIDRETIH